LGQFFERLLSVDAVHSFKPDPAVYVHAAVTMGAAIGELRLVSSNPFDVIGAGRAGMRSAWVDRAGSVFDTVDLAPDLRVAGIDDLYFKLAGT
jgi:2-haloacid dehalogenase